MKKTKKILVLSSLIYLSALSLTTLSGCSTNEKESTKYGNVSVSEDIVNGTVSASKLGNVEVDTVITILAYPREGYEIDKYYLNDSVLKLDSSNKATFKVVEGNNIIKVTFKKAAPITLYGTVEVISSKVSNGTLTPKLKDGTLIKDSNKRLPVGTEVFVDTTPVNKAYEINEIKLNDTTSIKKDSNGVFSFKVIEGKNFLSAKFNLKNPGKGLIDIDDSFKNGTLTIKDGEKEITNGSLIEENKELIITAVANEKYVTKYVKVNGQELKRVENTSDYHFIVKEGLVSIEVSFVFEASSLKINVPEGWIENETRWGFVYYVEEGATYDLSCTYEPEGSYAEIVWSKGNSDDDIEVTSDGKVTILNASENTNTIYATFKDNDSIKASIDVKPVSSGTLTATALKDKLAKAKKYELSNTKKVNFKYTVDDDYSSVKNEYSFESYTDGYTVTKVTDKEGATSYLYQGINDNIFYSLKKVGQNVSVLDSETVNASNESEYKNYLNTFGSIEFLNEYGSGEKYTGLADFYDRKIIDDVFTLDGSEEEIRKELVSSIDYDGYHFTSTCVTTGLYRKQYKTEVTSNISFNRYGAVEQLSFKRVDHELDSNGELLSSAKDQVLEYSANIEYGAKEADTNKYFDFNNYYYSDYSLLLYKDKNDKEGSKLALDSDSKYHVTVGSNVYCDLIDAKPLSALVDVDSVSINKNSYDISVYGSVKNGYTILAKKAGEYTLEFKSKNVTKTLIIVAEYAPIESVTFKEVPDSLYTNASKEIKAIVNPSSSVENSNVSYSFVGDDLGCKIIKDGSKYMLVAGEKTGNITIKATAKGDSSKFVTKTIKVLEVPSIYDAIKGKTYYKAETDWSTYDDITYTLEFSDVSLNTLKGTLKIKNVEYYTGAEKEVATYEFNANVKGNLVALSDIKCTNESLKDKLSPSIIGSLNSDGSIDTINITYGEKTIKLKEKTSTGGEYPGWEY